MSLAKAKKLKNGTVVKVKIGGKEYDTVIDKSRKAIQVFRTNALIRHLLDSGQITMDRLNADYAEGKFSQKEYLHFYMGLGYSVCGISELSFFENLEIENPLWD